VRRALIAVAVVSAAAVTWTLLRPTAAGEEAVPLPSRTTDAGGVEVAVTPVRVDGDGAVFRLGLDTHTVDLDVDPADNAALVVGATAWGPARWDGDGAGGHHREGELTFPARGPAEGPVRLTIGGLPTPVLFEWDLGQRG
jgi:hypothetical protein